MQSVKSWGSLFIALCLCIGSVLSLDDSCVFRGRCGTLAGLTGDLPVPCVDDSSPRKVENKTLIAQLARYCPDMGLTEDPTVCCDDAQINNFVAAMALPQGFLDNCPSCFVNFARVFCHMTCSRHQGTFVKVTESEPSTISPTKLMVSNITYAISSEYAKGLFDSCEDVLIPDSDVKALSMMCPLEKCCPYSWLEYMGAKGSSPIEIDFDFTASPPKGLTSLNPSVFDCNDVAHHGLGQTCVCH